MSGDFLPGIFGALSSTTKEFSADAVGKQLDEFKKRLDDESDENKVVRLWIEPDSAYGHQWSTVNIMYRLARPVGEQKLEFGYAGTIEVYYTGSAELAGLSALIPELGVKTSGKVDGATVKLIDFAQDPPASAVNFGFTATAGATVGLAEKLNVNYCLRLQPFGGDGPEQIEFLEDGKDPVDLTKTAEVGGERFPRRLYTVDESLYAKPAWQTFLDAGYPQEDKTKLEIVRYLVSDDVLKDYQLQAVYGLRAENVDFNQNAAFGAALVTAAVLRWQKGKTSYDKAKPTIIVNFDDFGSTWTGSTNTDNDALTDVLAGDFAPGEIGFKLKVDDGDRDAKVNFGRRSEFFKQLDAVADPPNPDTDRVRFLPAAATLDNVKTAVSDIANNQTAVLFIPLGSTFPAVFNNAMAKSSLPPILQGERAADIASNFGHPYMQVAPADATETTKLGMYPAVSLSEYSSQPVPQALLSNAAQMSSSPSIWPETAALAPPLVVGSYYRTYTDETDSDDPIGAYFSAVKEFFASAEQDKLTVAVAYLNSLLPAIPPETNPLVALWDKLDAAIKKKEPIDLVPGILTPEQGSIGKFITKMLTDFSGKLTLTGATLDPETKPDKPEDNLKTVTLNDGTTDAFVKLGVTNKVTIVFTAPKNSMVADFTFEATEKWSMPDAPWMVFDRPFIELTLPDASLPVAATIGGYYPGLEGVGGQFVAKLQIAIGGADGVWAASIDFPDPLPPPPDPPAPTYPGIASVYQMATGFNVVNSLPAPFNVLSDLGVKTVKVDYDFDKSVVNSLAVVAKSNTKDLPLFGKLELGEIVVTAVVLDPMTARQLVLGVSAEFNLGPNAVAQVSFNYPDIVLQGSLKSGTPTFTDLLETFGVPEIELPHQPKLDQFAFTYNKSTDYLAVSAHLTMDDWKFEFAGKELFSLDGVGFSITRDKGTSTGNVTAQTKILGVGVDIGGYYLANKDLKFVAKTTSPIDIKELITTYLGAGWVPDGISLPTLEAVSVELVWGKNGGAEAGAKSFQFSAKTKRWAPIEALGDDFSAAFELNVGFEPESTDGDEPAASSVIEAHVVGESPPATALAVAGDGDKAWKGTLSADMTLWFINLKVEYDFQPGEQQVCVTWTDVGVRGCVKEDTDQKTGAKETIATFDFTKDQTIGGMIEQFVSWATGTKFGLMAPFNVLNDISLSGLKVTYNFTKKKVDFTVPIGPIDLGLFTLKGITLAYNPEGNPLPDGTKSKNKVELTVDGSFVWESGDEPLKWEPDDPSTTPAPPGGGNKYFDLRLLALGQHVTVDGLLEAKSVAEIIDKLEKLDLPKLPEIPVGGPGQVTFAPDSSWFVAFDFGILKVETKKDGETPSASAAIPSSTGDAGAIEVAGGGLPVASAAADDEKPAQYFISLAIVFNDPYVYGLRIALEGPMAKVFAGLDFQIMYQQVSKNVGKYSAQIALPTVMRRFQIGVASITLPVFGIEIYTNGDFQVDIGFPWKEDFSRSFSVEFQAGPFPVTGAAGFYFGKLSSATTDKVPEHKVPGWFNPVIVFGFGARIGLGKSIEAGILSAGFSVTVFGIIEGVLARWQPYKEITTGGDKNQLQDGFYFSLTGTVGLQGRLYGSINFAIISAELDVKIMLFVRITFASYEPIPITAKASVSVTLTVKINLGLFKISIHLSFKASIEVTFVLDNPMGDENDAPWNKLPPGELSAHAAPELASAQPASARLRARGLAKAGAGGLVAMSAELSAMAADGGSYDPVWANLLPGSGLRVNGWVVPVLTVAGDLAFGEDNGRSDPSKNDPGKQATCYVLNFFVQGEPPVQTHDGDELTAHSAAAGDAQVVAPADLAQVALDRARSEPLMAASAEDYTNTFEDLAIRVLQWVIAAGQTGQRDPAGVDELTVSEQYLSAALAYLSGSKSPTPIDSGAIEAFLNAQAKFLFNLELGDNQEPATAVFFPAAPGLKLQAPASAEWGPFDYTFGGYNSSSTDYLTNLNTYFNQLKVQVEAEDKQNDANAAAAPTNDGPSVGSYIFGDYFAMIGRITIQAMLDGLRDFKLPLVDFAGKTVDQIVEYVNTKMGVSAGAPDAYTVGELLVANPKHPLRAGAVLSIKGMRWQSPGGKSLDDIAKQTVFKGAFDAIGLGVANAANATIIAPGANLVNGAKSYRTQSADTLDKIAVELGFGDEQSPDVRRMLTEMAGLQTLTTLLAPQSILDVPDLTHTAVATDQLRTVAAQYGLTLDGLAPPNGGVADLFATVDPQGNKTPNIDVPHLPQFEVGALIDEMKRTLALQHSAAMASRYYLHGLRLPTAFGNADGLTANEDGLFVKKGEKYPADMGLFGLTGQAFALPDDIPDPSNPGDDAPYAFTVSTASDAWISLKSDGAKTVTFEVSTKEDYDRYRAVQSIAKGYLDTKSSGIKPIDVGATAPGRYPLSTEIPWQPAVDVTLPGQVAPPTTPRPRMWQLPTELINVPAGTDVHPTVRPVVARSNEALGTTVDEPVANFGFGTLVTFKVRRLDSVASSGVTTRTYEVIGAPESEITLLERLLDQLQDDATSFDQVNLFYRPTSTSSQVAGWQSDDPATTLMGLSKTNLSTETRPPGSGVQAMAATGLTNLIGTPNEFLRLLWEASITRSGGFYLNYNTGIPSDLKGLPDHAFNDKGEAEVAVCALFAHGSADGQALANFMNVAATNESLDLSNAALVAEAVEVDVAAPRVFQSSDTLRSYAESYYTGAGVLAELNPTLEFRADPVIDVRVDGGVYQVPPRPPNTSPTEAAPYGDLALIAQHFKTDVGSINAVNAGDPLPATLSVYTAIKLPAVTVPSTGQSFAKLSQYFGAPIAELAAANLDVAGLFDKALRVRTGPTSLAPTVDRGVAGMTLERTVPNVPNTPTGDWGTQYLLQNFSLLGYLVAANPENPYFPASNWGLPSGPIEPDSDSGDKVQAPSASATDWNFRFAVPYSKLLGAGPYGGVGGILQFELAWLDIFGNRILTELDNPAPAAGVPLQGQPQLTGYTDRLVGVGQWPGVANAFRMSGQSAPTLTLELHFDPTSYQAAATAIAAGVEPAKTSGEQKLDQAIAAYDLIVQQLNDPTGVTIELTTTITSKAWPLPDSIKDWAGTILAFLKALKTDPAAPVPDEYEFPVSLVGEAVNPDQIFKLETKVTVKRVRSLVAGELATVAGVAEAATVVAPWTGSLTANTVGSGADETSIQRDLTTFAREFTAAFGTVDNRSYRIATGADREVFAGSGKGPLWVVQLGTPAAAEPISYTIVNTETNAGQPVEVVGHPTVYAPRPISNTLRSRAVTPIVPYETGKPIDPNGPVDNRSFSDIDLDKWMTTTLGYIDELLTPKFVVPAQILRSKIGSNTLQRVLDAKESLAKNLKDVMIAVYVGEHPSDDQLRDIQEAFRQTMLATMGGFYAVKAGIQFEAAVHAAIKRQADATNVPRVYGDVRMNPPVGNAVDLDKSVSVSSPKLDLAFAPDGTGTPPPAKAIPAPSPYLSSLVSSTSVEAKKVTLNLDYDGQYIEHQIGVIEGIPGYQPSSWLSFVDIDPPTAKHHSNVPLHAALGQFDVPIVLRAFPTTPTLVNQDNVGTLTSKCHQPLDAGEQAPSGTLLSGMTCQTTGDYDPLAAATRWNYSFTYSLQHHYEQDEIHGEVSFNIPEDVNIMAADVRARDIFDNLAQFTQVYPRVRSDLNQFLAPIDVDSKLGPELTNAEAALESAAQMIEWLAASPPKLPAPDPDELTASAAAASVSFVISEVGVPKDGVTALQVTVALAAPLPPRVGLPFVEIAGYHCERQTNDPVDPTKGVFLYKDDNGDYLPASDGAKIAARTFVLPDLDILERQDAQSEVYITRNADLVPGKVIVKDFIYQTPTVSFEGPLHPTLFSDDQINLATIYSTGGQDPLKRTLDCQLSLLYQSLFAKAGTSDVTMQASLYYEYQINPAIDRVRLPVYLMPPTRTRLNDAGTGTPLSAVVDLQVRGWTTWFAANTPQTEGGQLVLDLTVMSDLTAKPMPILHLAGLFVPYADLD